MNSKLPAWLTKEIKLPIKPRPRRKPTVWALRFEKSCKFLLLLLLAVFIIWRVHLHFEIKKKFAAIRAAGLPANPAELNTWYRQIPDSNNAAPLLAEGFALLRVSPNSSSNIVTQPKLIDRRENWSEQTRKLIMDCVATNSQALAKAQEAVQRSTCRYPVDFSYGLETKLPHLENLKTLAHVTALRALLAAEDGRFSNWENDVRLILRLAKTLEHEPSLLSQLVRQSLITTAARTIERSFNVSSPTLLPDDLAIAFSDSRNTNSFRLGLIGERASAIPVFRMSSSEMQRIGGVEAHQPLSGKPNPFLWLTGFLERDLNFYLDTMDANIVLSTLPPPASLAATNLAKEISRATDKGSYLLAGLLNPSLSRTFVKNATTLARISLVEIALSIERFRRQKGELPENLSQLTPEFLNSIPVDPFNSDPLHYRRLENGYVIYSVDQDGHDDGGREKPVRVKSTDRSSYDVDFYRGTMKFTKPDHG